MGITERNIGVPKPVVMTSGDVTIRSGFLGAVSITADDGANIVEVATGAADGLAGTPVGLITVSRLFGYNQEDDRWERVRVNKSGQGAVLIATSGQHHVVIAGESGDAPAVLNGNAIDGEVNYHNRIVVQSYLTGYDEENTLWNLLRINKSGQGALVVASSGQDYILAKTSGETHISKVSGETVEVASGAVTTYFPPTGLLHGYTAITAKSGGEELYSGPCVHTVLKNVSLSGIIWIGSAAVPIQSGEGYRLKMDEEIPLDIDNLNRIYCLAELSGDCVSWIAEVE